MDKKTLKKIATVQAKADRLAIALGALNEALGALQAHVDQLAAETESK